jgi:RNA polymerase sigma factor (sigma-70 family)
MRPETILLNALRGLGAVQWWALAIGLLRRLFMHSRTLGPLLHSLHRFCALQGNESCTDADLLERFTRARDQDAFAALVYRHGPMVLGVCRRLIPDRHDAEDAFQATFLVLVRKAGALRQPQQLGPWLHGVAQRVASRLRDRLARRQPLPEGLDLPEARDTAPVDRLAALEVRSILDEEIALLPGKYRLPVILCYLQGHSYTDAARLLGWAAGTVSSRLDRARKMLRERFVRRGLAPSASLAGNVLGLEAVVSPVPATLFNVTMKAGLSCASGMSALAGVVSQQVRTLVEGALQTMWMSKFKLTLCVVLVCAGLGGLVWHQGPQLRAQAPYAGTGARPPAPRDEEQDQASKLDEVERQLQALQEQIQEKQRLLYKLRQGNALDQIEAALKKLKQANASDPQRRAAVEEFEHAFGRLRQNLAGKASTERERFRLDLQDRVSSCPYIVAPDTRGGPMRTDGRVLQVNLENKQVLLSTPTKGGIKKGRVYRVYQGGKATPDQTGWIRITQAESKWAIGTILLDFSPSAPMQPGDNIQLHDGKEPDWGAGSGAGAQ